MLAIVVALLIAGNSVSFAASATQKFSTSAQSAIVMERSSGRVLFEDDAHKQLPMASTTKIVTALTVLMHADITQTVCVPKDACGVEGSSVYLKPNEHLTVLELLQGLMLRSGNDCAVALAMHVGGSVSAFCQLMNQTATSLGCSNSNFENPHGLPCDNHYTTACDLAKITCAALQNETFKQIVATKSVRISNEFGNCDRVLLNKNKLLANFDGADGVKTGYTKKAGRCFVGSATRNGMQVVVVVLNCAPMFEETAQLLNAAFANYNLQQIVSPNKPVGSALVGGKRQFYLCEKGFCYPLAKDETPSVSIDLCLPVPTLTVTLNEEIIFTDNLKKI